MDITITPGKLSGQLEAIPSKSQAHRYLICAAFADKPTTLICPETNQDIEATASCLSNMSCIVSRTDTGYYIEPIDWDDLYPALYLNCHESGSTLRFLLPVIGALGLDVTIKTEGRLSKRPLSPLWEEMERMGCQLKWISSDELSIKGKLRPGTFRLRGDVSSQFITGLLLAAPLMDGNSTIEIISNLESMPYVTMTQKAMKAFGVDSDDFYVTSDQTYRSPGTVTVEGDWSNGAFFLAAKALGNAVDVTNLNSDSAQGDRAAATLIPALKERITIDASDIPDLVPILAVVAGANQGAVFTNIQRLRLKESDRVASVIAMLESLGGKAEASEDTLTVYGTGYRGGNVNGCNDHRIVMATAIAATICTEPVTIFGAEAVNKSYPKFWDEFRRLGGNYEQHIR